MRLVQKAALFPHHCAVWPASGQAHRRGYLDTGMEMPIAVKDQRVYVSVVAAEEMARFLGWSHPSEIRHLRTELARKNAELDQAKADLKEAERTIDAVDRLESAGYVSRKKPGRPRREEVEA